MSHKIPCLDRPATCDAAPPPALVSALISAFRHSPVGLAVRTGTGRLVDANPAYCRMLGYERDELLALDLIVVVHPEDLEIHAARIEEMVSGELDVLRFEQRLCRKDGTIFWAMVTVTAIRGDDGSYHGMFALVQDITAQKQFEAHHRAQEDHLATLIEHLPIALYSLDLDGDGEFPYISPRFTQITGLGASELAGDLEKMIPHIHPDDYDAIWQADERSARTGEPFHLEFRLRGRDGDWRWVDNHSELIRDDAGNPHSWKGIILDVNERKRLEASLHESETRFRRAFEDAAIGMSLGGPDYTCLDANAAYCRLIGLPREQIIGRCFVEFTHSDDRPRESLLYAQLRRGEIDSYQIEKRYQRGDGSILTAHLTVAAVRDEQGVFLYDIGQLQDLTAQRAAEAALRDSEENLRAILEQQPAAVYRIDQDSDDYAYVSPRFTALTGVSNDHREGSFAAYCALVHPDDHPDLQAADAVATATGEPLDAEYRVLSPDGTWRWVNDRAMLMLDQQGAPRSWLGVLLDITERKHLEATLRDHETRLQTVVENLPAALYRIEPGVEGYYSYGSSRFVALTGLSPDQERVDSTAYRARIHPDDVAAVQTQDRESAATGRPFDCEYRLRGGNDDWVWVHDRSRPDVDGDENVAAWHGILIDITERKRLEEALQEKEARLQALVEQLPAAVYQYTPGAIGGFTYGSARFEELTGLSLERGPVSMEGLLARIHPDDRDAVRATDEEAERTGRAFVCEFRIQSQAGEWIWIETRSTPQSSVEGVIVAWNGVMIDVSERKRLHAELEKNQAHLQVLVEQSPAALYSLESCGEGCRYTYLSPQFAALTGLTLNDPATGFKRFLELIHPDDQAEYRERDRQAIIAGEAFDHEYRLRDPEANWIWIHERSVFTQHDASPLRIWHGVLIDVTERRQLEASSRENEALVKAIFDRAGIGMTLADLDGTILLANPEMGHLLGYASDELIGHNVKDFTQPDDMTAQLELRRQLHAGEIDSFQIEKRYVRRDGSIIWGLLNVAPVWDEHGVLKAATGQVQDITARKEAEAAFRESESRFRTVFEEAAIGMALIALEDRMLVANPALARFLGYTPEELAGASLHDITFPGDVPAQLALRGRMRAGEIDSYQLEKRYKRKDGALVWGVLSVSGVRDSAGALQAVVAQVQDITARKEAEAAFKESETRFRTIFEGAGVGMALGTPTGEVIVANPAMARFLGCLPEGMIGLPVQSYTFPEDFEIQRTLRAEMVAGEINGYAMEKRYVRCDGEIVWGLANVNAIRDDAGNLTATIGQVQNITARKEAEEALRNSEARFRALVQNDPDVILVINGELDIIYASPSSETIFGITADVLLGPAAPRLVNIHPEDIASAQTLLESVRRVAGSTASTEVRLHGAEEEWRWFQLTVSNHLPNPSIGGFVCNLRDITERKEGELATVAALQTQQAAIAELEQLNQSKSRFLSTISHEFRTPLTAIIGYSELLAISPDPKLIAEDAAIIYREASRLNRMVNDVLLVERLDSGRLQLKLQPVDLNALVCDVVEACRPLAARHDFVLDLDPRLRQVSADHDRLAQALTNLIGNAIKYSAPGDPITITTRDGEYASIAVRDEGIGIAGDDLERIFGRFERVEHGMAGRVDGTGLGLAIARDIAELHHGHLTADSTPGHGSTFTLVVPADHYAPPPSLGASSRRAESAVLAVP